jgi:hypothetical protein
MALTCNPSTLKRLRQEDYSLDYMAKKNLKRKRKERNKKKNKDF